MEALCNALAFAMAYLGTVERESDGDEDNDATALESIASYLSEITDSERKALQQAAQLAIQTEKQSKQPNHSLIEGYQSVIEHLAETEG
jgi:hypothetical protein